MLKTINIIFITIFIFSCTGNHKKEFGKKLDIDKFTNIKNLKKYPQNYLNDIIKVKGIVIEENSRGSWVTIRGEDNAVIYINFDYEPEIKFPTMLSNQIIAIGRFVKNRYGYYIMGKWLKIIK